MFTGMVSEELIEKLRTSTIEVYGKSQCIYCDRAKGVLADIGVAFAYIDAGQPENRAELLERVPGVKTVPQIFINGELIGGFDDLVLYLKGN